MEEELYCENCDWSGDESHLVHPPEQDDWPYEKCTFDRCPDCGSDQVYDFEDD